jgi:RNA polymerase sigma-70 factor (ECF subfamily)
MSYNHLEDAELVSLYIQGTEPCLEILIKRHQRKLFAFILKNVKKQELAEDLFQDIFIKIINSLKLDKYNEEGKFGSWVLRVARNHLMDFFRNKGKLKTFSGTDEFDIFDVIPFEDATNQNKLERHHERKRVRKLVWQLPHDMRQVVVMRTYFDMTFTEIADWQNVGINTALGRMHNALKHLRKSYHDSEETKQFFSGS